MKRKSEDRAEKPETFGMREGGGTDMREAETESRELKGIVKEGTCEIHEPQERFKRAFSTTHLANKQTEHSHFFNIMALACVLVEYLWKLCRKSTMRPMKSQRVGVKLAQYGPDAGAPILKYVLALTMRNESDYLKLHT